MIILFIVLMLLGLAGLVALGFGLVSKETEIGVLGGGVALVVAVLTVFMSLTNVDAKNVGIQRFGGNVYSETLDGGWHLKAPWVSVNEVNGAEQSEDYHDGDGIQVSLGDRSETKMSVNVRWRINTEKASEIYQNYRGDDPVTEFRNRVVSPQIKSAAVNAAQGYNPLSQLKSINPAALEKGFEFKVDYQSLAAQIKAQVEKETLGLADIISVTVTKLPLSESSQNRVNTFIASISDTLIAQQEVKTAEQKALANEKIANSLRANPAVNVANCIEAVKNSAPGTFPPGFSCSGAGAPFVVTK